MRKNDFRLIAYVFLIHLCLAGGTCPAPAQAKKAAYPAMAPIDEYLVADQNSEIALARSAAPASIADGAEVMVLGKGGFTTAVKGTNGFLCVVERSWGAATGPMGRLLRQWSTDADICGPIAAHVSYWFFNTPARLRNE